MPSTQYQIAKTSVPDKLIKAIEDIQETRKVSVSAAIVLLAAKGYEGLYGDTIPEDEIIRPRGGYRIKKEDQAKLNELEALKNATTK